MKRNWNWLGRIFLCALLICALLATVAVADEGDVSAQGNLSIENGDGLIPEDGMKVDLEDGSIPLDLSLQPNLELSLSDSQASENDMTTNASDDDALRVAESIEDGYYKIVAANGRGEGDELYWDRDASWKDMKWKKEGDIWHIHYNKPIRLAENEGYILNIEHLRGGVAVKCTHEYDIKISTLDQNRGLYLNVGVFKEEGSKDYSKVTLRFATKWDQEHSRPYYALKMRRVLSAGNDYVQAQKFLGLKSALWSLVPVNYSRSFQRAALGLSANKDGEVTINWEKLRNKVKNLKIWKEAKYVEVQCSTDKNFEKGVKSKKVEKEKVTKENAKTALNKLKKGARYYVRARLWDANGVYSNWSKVGVVTTKK